MLIWFVYYIIFVSSNVLFWLTLLCETRGVKTRVLELISWGSTRKQVSFRKKYRKNSTKMPNFIEKPRPIAQEFIPSLYWYNGKKYLWKSVGKWGKVVWEGSYYLYHTLHKKWSFPSKIYDVLNQNIWWYTKN